MTESSLRISPQLCEAPSKATEILIHFFHTPSVFSQFYLWDLFSGGSDSQESTCNAGDQTWVPALGQEDPLEEGMATHSSILAWRIPWTEEPGWLQSMGSQRVRHDRVTNTFASLLFTKIYY